LGQRESCQFEGDADLEKDIAIVECAGYDPETIQEAVNRLVQLLGGWETFVKPGENIVIKPNLLMRKSPDEAVTTHPAVIEAAARSVIGAGGRAILADSPGGPFNARILQWVYKGCGLTEAASRSGAILNINTAETTVKVPAGGILAGITILEEVARADGVVSISKLKTHGLTRMTGAVKNLFGVIPGLKKAEYHFRMPGVEEFSAMLVDVARTVSPRLHIIDAVTGMEGEGPSGGDPVHIGLLLAGTCPFTLDLVAAALVGIRPNEVPTIAVSIKRGYISGDIKNVRLLGDPVSLPRLRFRLPPKSVDIDLLKANSRGRLPGWLISALNRRLRPYPVFNRETCKVCGECARICPAGAIGIDKKIPVPDLDRCIRCFCCQELCPQRAVKINRPWLGRVLFK
jgi:uncharacterized protein (DUF362 family)/Pyruvate/2-oxoacid:ferredoxin oxidoreductase delta subunit